MKRAFLIILFFSSAFINSFGQTKDPKDEKHEKIRAYKIAFITDRINLTSTQAEAFWPVYDEFDNKRRNNYRQQKSIYKRSSQGGLSDKENLENQERILELKQEDVDLNKAYRTKFLKIISPQQFTQLMDAEHDFHELLMEQLKGRNKN